MKVAIIGHGAIARYVRADMAKAGCSEIAQIVRPGKEAQHLDAPPCISDLQDLSQKPDLLIDCGGHAALAMHGPVALELGIDVLTVSLGALADQTLETSLRAAAIKGNARLHLASGAIGGLDALRAARAGGINMVRYTGRKPPNGWQGSPAEKVVDLIGLTTPFTHFSASARDAALAYPKNANVAAAVALAGIGFDATIVELIADPDLTANIHKIDAQGAFGTFTFEIAGQGLPDNPRSSALAAMSILSDLIERRKPVGF